MKFLLLILGLMLTTSLYGQSLPEVSIGGVGIYPNPFNEQIFVRSENQVTKVEIYTEAGNKIVSVNASNVVEANRLQKGVYIIKLYFEDQVIVMKALKD